MIQIKRFFILIKNNIMIKNESLLNLTKCSICHKYKCVYYNYKTPFLSEKICYLCIGKKEVCYKVKPDVYKVYLCNICLNNNYLQHNFTCDLCLLDHKLCLCDNAKELHTNYPYTLPY